MAAPADSLGRALAEAIPTKAEQIELGRAIQAWLQHPDGPEAAPENVRRRGRRALDRMVAGNTRLVMAEAQRASRRQMDRQPANHVTATRFDPEELFQIGCLGLHQAAMKFDPTRGYTFATYARNWIRQAITRHIYRDGLIIVPTEKGQIACSATGHATALQAATGRLPTAEEIAGRMGAGITAAMVEQSLACAAFCRAVISGDASGRPGESEDRDTLLTMQSAPQEEEWWERLDRQDQRERVLLAIRSLPFEDQRLLLDLHWEGRTLTQAAKERGTSRCIITSRVQRLYRRIRSVLSPLPSTQSRQSANGRGSLAA